MIELYQAAPCWGLPDLSPFSIKLHTYFRMTKLPYQVGSELTLQDAPKGKIPFIRHNGKLIGDSNLIIEYFKKTLGIDPDEHLSKEEQAISLAFRRLIEENLYWVAIYSAYAMEENWQIYKTVMKKLLKPLTESTDDEFFEGLRAQILKECWGQGMSRHSEPEIFEIGQRDLRALADFLGEKPFFMGAKPTILDATAYGFLARIISDSLPTPVKEYALRLSNIQLFCDRLRAEFYTEEETKLWQVEL